MTREFEMTLIEFCEKLGTIPNSLSTISYCSISGKKYMKAQGFKQRLRSYRHEREAADDIRTWGANNLVFGRGFGKDMEY